MDLEIMEITVNEASYRAKGSIYPQHYRTIVRRTDHEGTFRRLFMYLESVAKQYSRDIDEIEELYGEVNCDKAALIEVLNGKNFTKWTELEDLCLKDPESKMFKFLVDAKGTEEIEKRRKFLCLRR